MRLTDIAQTIHEEDENLPQPPSREELKKRQLYRGNVQKIINAWNQRERDHGKHIRGLTYAEFGWTITRSFPDEDGELFDIDIIIEVSGEYEKGSPGGFYEPPYPAGYHGIEIVWAKIDSKDPNDPPLTMEEKINLEKEFDQRNSRLHDAAEQALLDEGGGRY